MSRSSDIGQAIVAAARSLSQSESLDEALHRIVHVARDAVPGFDHVGISTLHRSGKIETRAATSDLVLRLDQAQYDLGEGPCLDSLADSLVVAVPDIGHDTRWPRYQSAAVELGLRSQLAVKLFDDERTIGGLNLYSTTSDEIDPEAAAIAELLGAHAAIALGHAYAKETLNEALQTRKVIGQAIGIVMERYDMNEERAFAFLVRASSHANTKLRDIARELVEERNAR